MLDLCLSTHIALPHLFKMSAFVTYSCFEWCKPLVSGCVDCALFNDVPNIYLHDDGMTISLHIQQTKYPNNVTKTSVSGIKKNKLCAWRHNMPPPLSSARGRPSTSRAAKQTQRRSSFPRPIRSHGSRSPLQLPQALWPR